ncbi:hypothetical protein BJ912DRAFT_933957 [Pholiota molesta]|nr:hypothetical protein BJ912DRAFT_933957 [Pholiota molesta]
MGKSVRRTVSTNGSANEHVRRDDYLLSPSALPPPGPRPHDPCPSRLRPSSNQHRRPTAALPCAAGRPPAKDTDGACEVVCLMSCAVDREIARRPPAKDTDGARVSSSIHPLRVRRGPSPDQPSSSSVSIVVRRMHASSRVLRRRTCAGVISCAVVARCALFRGGGWWIDKVFVTSTLDGHTAARNQSDHRRQVSHSGPTAVVKGRAGAQGPRSTCRRYGGGTGRTPRAYQRIPDSGCHPTAVEGRRETPR